VAKKIVFSFIISIVVVSSVAAAGFSFMTYQNYASSAGMPAMPKTASVNVPAPVSAAPQWTLAEYRAALNRAAVRLRLNQTEEAIALYKEILAVNPYDAEVYKMLAYISAQGASANQNMAALNEARQYMENAFTLDPTQMDQKDEAFLASLTGMVERVAGQQQQQ